MSQVLGVGGAPPLPASSLKSGKSSGMHFLLLGHADSQCLTCPSKAELTG